jgi:hypothetical protein
MAVKVSESPVSMVTLDESCMDMSNVPEELAVQNEMSVSTSPLVPAHDVQAGVFDADTDPADGEPHVTAGRVVTDDTEVVPAEPGSAVCSCTKLDAGDVVSVVSIEFAMVALMPSATEGHLLRVAQDPLGWFAALAAGELVHAGGGAVERCAVAGARGLAQGGGAGDHRHDGEAVWHGLTSRFRA